MTKTRKGMVAGLAALGLSCCIMGTMFLPSVRVFAASDYNLGANDETGSEYAVYAGGRSKETVLKALNDKVAELNAAIDAATADGTTLEEAYAAGTIIVYSNIESNGHITSDNHRSNWKSWGTNYAVADLKYLNAGYNGWGESSVCALTYDGGANKAYIVTAEFADEYYTSERGAKLGTAVSDMFRVDKQGGGYYRYQNFSGGYMKSENGGSTSTVFGKNVTEDGTEVDADPVASGYVGAANESIAASVGTAYASFYKAFVDAYNGYKDKGINVGYPFSIVKSESGLVWQYFRNGDSTADPWNDSQRAKWAYLVYSSSDRCAYLVKDEFARVEETKSEAARALGAPTGDEFLASDGNRYQNFEKGYMKAAGSTAGNSDAEIVSGKNVDASGNPVDIDLIGLIGKLGSTVTDEVIPEKYTAESFTAAFASAYKTKVQYADGESLVSVDMVTYANGYISQTYTDNNNKQHVLAYVEDEDIFVYLRPAVMEVYISSLGKPIADRVTVAEKSGQSIYAYPFSQGYIKLTSSQQRSISGGQAVTILIEHAVALEGATYDAEKVFFESQSYSSQITASIINHSMNTNTNDQGIDLAYWSLWEVEKPTDEVLIAAFKKAYDDAFAMGFSAGKPATGGIIFWKSGDSGVVKLTLKGGNGNADFWGDNTLMTYNPLDGKVYITTGEIGSYYAVNGASGNGWATTDMMINTVTGVIVQQFLVIDPVVERPTYIIYADGQCSKIEGQYYDFDANENGGEWVSYLSQFAASISSNPISISAYKKGDAVSIDFADYIVNTDGYKLTWNLVSGSGALSADGVYTLDSMPAQNANIVIEVYSAFDKLTFNVTIPVEGASGGDEEDNPKNNTAVIVGCSVAAGVVALGGAGTGLFFFLRKRRK